MAGGRSCPDRGSPCKLDRLRREFGRPYSRAPMTQTPTAPSRDDAWRLLTEWTAGEPLRKHGLAVEAAVGWYGEHKFGIRGAELETWRAAGLLHDFDYERYPDTHPMRGAEELRRLGYPDEVVEAVLGHGDHTGVPRTSLLAKTVYARTVRSMRSTCDPSSRRCATRDLRVRCRATSSRRAPRSLACRSRNMSSMWLKA
jgi:hypothetical protein